MPSPCSYLGALDRDNARTEPVDYPTFENRCFAADPTQPLLLADQATYCLSGGCELCARFQQAQVLRSAGDRVGSGRLRAGRLGDVATAATFGGPPFGEIDDHFADAFNDDLGEYADDFGDGFAEEFDDGFDDTDSDGPFSLFDGWRWLGAGLIFVALLVVGGSLAAYAGYQIVLNRVPGGQVEIAPPNTLAQPLRFEVVTQTPEQQTAAGNPAPTTGNVAAAQGQPTDNFPPAVTASPVPASEQAAPPANFLGDNAASDNQAGDNSPAPVVAPPAAVLPVDTPPVDVYQPIAPTRRATPDLTGLIIPTPTPGDPNAPNTDPNLNPAPVDGTPAEPTATLTPQPLGTPIFAFEAAKPIVTGEPGSEFADQNLVLMEEEECVNLSWAVENVTAVYLNTEGVDGVVSQYEACVYRDPKIYTLQAVLANGNVITDSITLAVATPTPTFTPTPSFTPKPEITPTWTPQPPAVEPTAEPTATPNVTRRVELAASASEITCRVGEPCEVGLTVNNTGTGLDNITVSVVQAGAWPVQLYRLDGINGQSVPLEMGPGNSAPLSARFDTSAAVEASPLTYTFEAVSDGSGGTVRVSASVNVVVEQAGGS